MSQSRTLDLRLAVHKETIALAYVPKHTTWKSSTLAPLALGHTTSINWCVSGKPKPHTWPSSMKRDSAATGSTAI